MVGSKKRAGHGSMPIIPTFWRLKQEDAMSLRTAWAIYGDFVWKQNIKQQEQKESKTKQAWWSTPDLSPLEGWDKKIWNLRLGWVIEWIWGPCGKVLYKNQNDKPKPTKRWMMIKKKKRVINLFRVHVHNLAFEIKLEGADLTPSAWEFT